MVVTHGKDAAGSVGPVPVATASRTFRWLAFSFALWTKTRCIRAFRLKVSTMSNKSKLVIVGLLAALTCAAGIFIWPGGTSDTESLEEIRIGTIPIVATLPHWVALKKDLYKKHGIVPKSDPIKRSPDMISAMESNAVDFLPAVSLQNVVGSALDNLQEPQVCILSHSRMKKDIPFDCLLTTDGSPIASLKDLVGKKIGVFPGGTSQAALQWYLTSNNIPTTEISFVETRPETQIDLLLSGQIDAVHAYEPQRTLGILQYRCRMISPSIYAAIQEPASIGCTAISAKLLRDRPNAAKRLIAVWDEAVDFIRNNDQEARRILAEELACPTDVAVRCTWVDVTKSTELDSIALDRFIKALQQMGPDVVKAGDVPKCVFYGSK